MRARASAKREARPLTTQDAPYPPHPPPPNYRYWTEADWQYEFVEAIAKAPDSAVPAVFSISYGWSESDREILLSASLALQRLSASRRRFTPRRRLAPFPPPTPTPTPTPSECIIDPNEPACKIGSKGSAIYVHETNQGYAAAGLRGISIMVSSGDSGAHGRADPNCLVPKTWPDWPAASNYILAVGATMIKAGTGVPLAAPKSPFCISPPTNMPGCASGGTEIVASTAAGASIVSGGGFSNVEATPVWQATSVKAYLAAGGLLPPEVSDFNKTGRAYPDVSAMGHDYPVLVTGDWMIVDGTSCSSPVFAGVIALANAARLEAGKPTLGFVAPAIYAVAASTPSAFNDITEGDNKCTEMFCSANCTGFGAVKGFDIPTGFGTPNIVRLDETAMGSGKRGRGAMLSRLDSQR